MNFKPANPERRVTCKQCGETRCAWYKTKAGRFMLVEFVSRSGHGGHWSMHLPLCEVAMKERQERYALQRATP
jgi:hypothetical protein